MKPYNIKNENTHIGIFLLNFTFFIFCLRPPGFSFFIAAITLFSFVSMMLNKSRAKIDRKILPLIYFLAYMLVRCCIGFAFNGGYEERYVMVLILISCTLIIYISIAQEIKIEQCYTGILYALVATLIIVVYEMLSGQHMITSRYSNPSDEASLWGASKPTAFYYNENDMLSFIVCFLPFTFIIKNSVIRIIIFFFSMMIAIYIGSKAAIITIIIYGIFTKIIPKKIFVAIISVPIFTIGILFPTLINAVDIFFTNSSGRLVSFWGALLSGGGDESTSERLSIYLSNIDWLGNHPLSVIFGNGRFEDYNTDVIRHYGLRIAEFHNLHLEVITIFGVIFYFLFFGYYSYLWFKLCTHKTPENYPLLISTLMYPLIISFGPSSSLKYPFIFILLLLMIIAIRKHQTNE